LVIVIQSRPQEPQQRLGAARSVEAIAYESRPPDEAVDAFDELGAKVAATSK
jgi:hypothetical protein